MRLHSLALVLVFLHSKLIVTDGQRSISGGGQGGVLEQLVYTPTKHRHVVSPINPSNDFLIERTTTASIIRMKMKESVKKSKSEKLEVRSSATLWSGKTKKARLNSEQGMYDNINIPPLKNIPPLNLSSVQCYQNNSAM